MIVVCDSSFLINLSKIDQLRLLEEMYGGVLISPGIRDEVVRRGAGRAGSEAVEDATFIQVESVRNPDEIEQYTDRLSRQDAELIILAKEQSANLVISGDRNLRRRAAREGLTAITLRAFLKRRKKWGLSKR